MPFSVKFSEDEVRTPRAARKLRGQRHDIIAKIDLQFEAMKRQEEGVRAKIASLEAELEALKEKKAREERKREEKRRRDKVLKAKIADYYQATWEESQRAAEAADAEKVRKEAEKEAEAQKRAEVKQQIAEWRAKQKKKKKKRSVTPRTPRKNKLFGAEKRNEIKWDHLPELKAKPVSAKRTEVRTQLRTNYNAE